MSSPPKLTVAIVLGVLAAGAGSASALSPAPPAPAGRVTATLDACHQAAALAGRYATFGAQMTAVAGTAEMSIRFELDERTPAAPGFHPVADAPGFGMWTNSAPGVGIFGYSQEVSSLTAPATFRVTVMFRWLGPRHRVIKRARRTTPACLEALPPVGPVAGAAPPKPEATVVGTLCPADAGKPVLCG